VGDGAPGSPSVKLIAQYFPQLHAIPENDCWWGPGFTDWVNVRRARPLYRGHAQPRVPLGGDYYDQSREEVIRAQVALAERAGIYGFCHYHYWFDGRQLLETPTRLYLQAKDLQLKFCLAWANETWSRRWDGLDHQVLMQQTHPPDERRWELHFQYLLQAFTDERAIRIDGKPIFLIYRPYRILELPRLFEYWRTRALKVGLPGLYLVAMNQYGHPDPSVLKHFDAEMLFQPFVSLHERRVRKRSRLRMLLGPVKRRLPLAVTQRIDYLLGVLHGPIYEDYDRAWEAILARSLDGPRPIFPGAFVDWDNTARYGRRATVFRGASPERFEFWLRRLVGAVSQHREEERLIFINAWNEWAEGAYLEPDVQYGHGYLDAIRRVVGAPAEELGAHLQLVR
jgi:lipopolysaccharide biosynthesis protein